jgi:hypothetical protein
VSTCDLTLSIAFPANIRGRFTGDRLPRHSNNDSKLLYAIGTLLSKGLGIPAPRLLKALSQHDDAEDLSASLHRLWFPTSASGPRPASQRSSFLRGLDEALSFDAGLADPLLATPSDEPSSACHDQWHDLLNPATDTMTSASSPTGTRHVLRLAFNSALVATAVRTHIERYTALLLPAGEAHSPASLSTMEQWQRTWVTAAVRANAIHTVAAIDVYGIRYETTLLSGWTRGPDHPPSSPEGVDYHQLYGDDNRLLAYLARAAPHCFPCPPTMLADGTGSIQFLHEAQHRNELYRLQGVSSPPHGITRPLRLTFQQLRRPLAQCCSVCGHPGHTAHACSLHAASTEPAADEGKMEADVASLSTGSVVCRLCYSPGHREDCHTPPSLQSCKLCDETGHTSFRCTRYKTSWVPLSVPASTLPPNLRPLTLIAQQRGLAPPSWSSMVARTAPHPPSHLPPPPSLADPSAFPALPGTAPTSPTDSASSTSNPRQTPSSPLTPQAAQPSAELAELKAMVATQQQSLQRLQASMEAQQAANQQTMQRFDALLALFMRLLSNPPTKPLTPTGMDVETAPFSPPTPITAHMQHVEQKDALAPSPSGPTLAPFASPPLPAGNTFQSGSFPGTLTANFANVHTTAGGPVFGSSPPPPAAPHPPAYTSPTTTASSPPLHQ